MSKFRKKPVVIEATQWFKNGDHPCDGTERFPVLEISSNTHWVGCWQCLQSTSHRRKVQGV